LAHALSLDRIRRWERIADDAAPLCATDIHAVIGSEAQFHEQLLGEPHEAVCDRP
jgi:hypothetical protein